MRFAIKASCNFSPATELILTLAPRWDILRTGKNRGFKLGMSTTFVTLAHVSFWTQSGRSITVHSTSLESFSYKCSLRFVRLLYCS
jgi:hypothetical protein